MSHREFAIGVRPQEVGGGLDLFFYEDGEEIRKQAYPLAQYMDEAKAILAASNRPGSDLETIAMSLAYMEAESDGESFEE